MRRPNKPASDGADTPDAGIDTATITKSRSTRHLLLPGILFGFLCGYLTASQTSTNYEEISEPNVYSSITAISNSAAALPGVSFESITANSKSAASWPGVPFEELGHPLVKKGSSFVDDVRGLLFQKSDSGSATKTTPLMDEFLDIYTGRPDKVNICGIRINHALALFVTLKVLKPTTVIESGVNAGQSTYFIRKTLPDVKIISIDPLDEAICEQEVRWMDDNPNHIDLVGDKFQDIAAVDWVEMVKKGEIDDPEKTLVFLDDHQLVLQRFPALMKAGFRHILLEDNYKLFQGGTSMDRAGVCPKQLFARESSDSKFAYAIMETYAEFPPLVPPIMAKKLKVDSETERKTKYKGGFMFASDNPAEIVEPIMRPDINKEDMKLYTTIAKKLGFDPKIRDKDSWMQIMHYNQISYFKLIPFGPFLSRKYNFTPE